MRTSRLGVRFLFFLPFHRADWHSSQERVTTNRWLISAALVYGGFLVRAFGAEADPNEPPPQKANTWIKRNPLPGKEENARCRLETWVNDASRSSWTKMDPPRESAKIGPVATRPSHSRHE
jgi:hypothetical protein